MGSRAENWMMWGVTGQGQKITLGQKLKLAEGPKKDVLETQR